jgi:phage terminase large subunit-like protein
VADSKARGKNDPDDTGTTVVDIDSEGNWYVQMVNASKMNSPELIDWVFYIWETYKPIKIGIEKKALEDQVLPYIKQRSAERQIFPVVVELKPGGTNKIDRIRGALQGRLQHGKIKFRRNPVDDTAKLKTQLFDFPKGRHDDLCLDGETRIATLFGDKKIKDIKVGDLVITPFGIRWVLASGITGEKEVITNMGITGTHNHKVFNNSTFDNLDTIEYNSHISYLTIKEQLVWKYKKLLYLMEKNTTSWEGRENIILVCQQEILKGKILKDFMLRFGNFITSKMLVKALLFTIKTVTLSITTLIIWSVYQLGNTCLNTLKGIGKTQSSLREKIKILTKLDHSRKNGTVPPKEESGTENISTKLIHSPLKENTLVKLVARFLKVPGLKKLSFVPARVFPVIDTNRVSIISPVLASFVGIDLLRTNIQKLEHAEVFADKNYHGKAEKTIVYNITVGVDSVYYANNILVSNCDALHYISQIGSRPFSQGKDEDKSQLNRDFYAHKRKQQAIQSARARILNL